MRVVVPRFAGLTSVQRIASGTPNRDRRTHGVLFESSFDPHGRGFANLEVTALPAPPSAPSLSAFATIQRRPGGFEMLQVGQTEVAHWPTWETIPGWQELPERRSEGYAFWSTASHEFVVVVGDGITQADLVSYLRRQIALSEGGR
jgi:hypothetical protein